jgi:hypothetical protein
MPQNIGQKHDRYRWHAREISAALAQVLSKHFSAPFVGAEFICKGE